MRLAISADCGLGCWGIGHWIKDEGIGDLSQSGRCRSASSCGQDGTRPSRAGCECDRGHARHGGDDRRRLSAYEFDRRRCLLAHSRAERQNALHRGLRLCRQQSDDRRLSRERLSRHSAARPRRGSHDSRNRRRLSPCRRDRRGGGRAAAAHRSLCRCDQACARRLSRLESGIARGTLANSMP